jgi:hypothetical protein
MKIVKPILFIVVFALVFSFAACGSQSQESKPVSESLPAVLITVEPGDSSIPYPNIPLEGLVLDEYADLKLTAEVLDRKAIQPGNFVPITVLISNNGAKTISYVQGSGSYVTPEALSWSVPELQWVWPKDYLGVSTSDFVIKKLTPGESINFVIYVMAIERNPEQFVTATHELYDSEGIYIADMGWDILRERYPWMKPIQTNTYTGEVNFKYSMNNGDTGNSFLAAPTGYAQSTITIGVTE